MTPTVDGGHNKYHDTTDSLWHEQHSIVVTLRLHYVSKKTTDVAHYNYDMHEGTLIIFSKCVTKKIAIRSCFFHLT